MYIYRELLDKIRSIFQSDLPKGLIVSGIVGCGKTTVIEHLIDGLSEDYKVFTYSGDDSVFRSKVAADSKYIYNEIVSKTTERSLVFVDEVQKSEHIFDAIKYAFDNGKISFIVSGSNPAYLSTVAKKRLQRRADQILMLPISLSELMVHNKWASKEQAKGFGKLLWNLKDINDLELPKVSVTSEITTCVDSYLKIGGLPLAHLEKTDENALREIKLVVERGFELMSVQNNAIADLSRIELAFLHSKEFTYKNILQQTRTRKRDDINSVIDNLINHSYLVRKKPVLLVPGKTSYLSIFSYIDPGIISYLTGNLDIKENKGARVEGYVHTRLNYMIENSQVKSSLGYYKPHSLDINGNVKYSPGEIDFIFKTGQRMIPIEVKSTDSINEIDSSLIKKFIKINKLKFGIIIYKGAPHISKSDKLIYWPYWLL